MAVQAKFWRIVSLRATAFGALALAACGSALLVNRQPRLKIETRGTRSNEASAARSDTLKNRSHRAIGLSCDFGVISPKADRARTLTVRNDGATAWTVANISRTCACTVTRIVPTSIPPGKSAKIEVLLRAPRSVGDTKKSIAIRFAEVNTPQIVIDVRARARIPLSTLPDVIDFGHCLSSKNATAILEVHTFTPQPLSSLVVNSAAPWLRAELLGKPHVDERSGSKQVWTVRATAQTSELPLGTSRASIVVGPSDGEPPAITIQALVYIKGPLEVSPRKFFFDRATLGATVRSSVVLDVASLVDFESAPLDISHDLPSDDFDIEIERRQRLDDGRWVVVLAAAYTPHKRSGAVHGCVRLGLRGINNSSVEVPVYAFVP